MTIEVEEKSKPVRPEVPFLAKGAVTGTFYIVLRRGEVFDLGVMKKTQVADAFNESRYRPLPTGTTVTLTQE